MKPQAIAITAREQAELLPIEVPSAPEIDCLLGPTLCTLMSPGTELAHNYLGKTFPSFPGYSAVFAVEQIGADVTGFSVGDQVFAMGPHRGYQQVKAENVLKVPAGLSPQVAVLARLMGVSMTTLMTTTARPGDLVVITGAGPVGFLAAQLFRLSGYHVQVVEPDDARRTKVAALDFVCHAQLPIEELQGRVALVVECSGHEQAVLDGCAVVRRRGEVVLVGVPWKPRTDLTAHELLSLVFHKYVVLRSGWEWELPHHPTVGSAHCIYGNFAQALDWLATGQIHTEGLIQQFSPADAQAAYQANLHHQNDKLFTVFDWE